MDSFNHNDFQSDLFESEPSINELLTSAKKFLNLQPRLDNRHLRNSNSQSQLNHMMNNTNYKDLISPQILSNNHDKVLDLLSPLSMDELKNSAMTSTTTTTTTSNSSNTKSSNSNYTSPKKTCSNLTKSFQNTNNSTNNSTNITTKLTECHNCGTQKTPLWRKNSEGQTLCNACGLFQKLHGRDRPLALKSDVIKKRNSRKITNNSKSLNSNQFINTGIKYEKSKQPAPSSLPNTQPTYKQILPKITPTTTTSIPIPSRSSLSSSPQPFSPYSSSSSSYTINNNQPFKRKKSEINLEESGTPLSSRSRQQSTTSLSSIPQRKNSYINRRTSVQNSFTSNNMRFPQQSTYFENPIQPCISRHNSTQNFDTPKSYNSTSSLYRNEDATPNSIPATPNVADLLPRSRQKNSLIEEYRASKPPIIQYQGIDDEMLLSEFNFKNIEMNDDDFFKSYTSLHQESEMDDFIKKEPAIIEGFESNFNKEDKTDYKDLDWLKFEI
ncbi:unnamed protein product [Candida verbasci]|uniref:GATA-type domain-containing protein n=1 Tax=Candida verbasci TaxID=1227364 RepID=A0A9W4TZ41_9ASCO|nr:unnamed protein product [Candida verbasci]